MKRKIKFRRLHCGSFIYDDEENCCVFWGGLSEKEEESLSQFTGLFDKNGKEIYEGDIISVFYTSRVEVDCWKATVKWLGVNPSFVLQRVNPRFLSDFEEDFVKCGLLELLVIGNIFENPELLETRND